MLKTFLFIVLAFSCSQKAFAQQFSILGEWEGKSPKQEKILYNFQDDRSVIWTIINQENIKQIVNAKYKVEFNSSSNNITIYDFDEPTLMQMNVEFQGTIKIISDDTIEIKGKQIIAQSGNDKNPKYFDQPPIILSRVIE